jgi:hypothetical protein
MARVRRIDLGSLASPTRRADGTMVAQARITRTGVFTYRNADGSERKEYRPTTSVHDAKSLASFQLVPITDDHPPSMLTSQNARMFSVGAVGQDVHRDGDHVVATIGVHDANTIKKMDAGKVFVSCGYDCELDETPGTAPNGEHYDAVQTQIVGNHLAIVDNPRAGVTAAVRMDAMYGEPDDDGDRDDNELNAEARNKIPAKEFAAGDKLPIENAAHVRAAMSRFGQTQFESPAQKKSAFHKIVAKANKLGIDTEGFEKAHKMDASRKDSVMDPDKLAELIKKNETHKHERDAATARADASDKALATLQAKFDDASEKLAKAEKAHTDALGATPTLIKARVALEAGARKVLGSRCDAADGSAPEVKLEDMTDRAIKLAIIKHVTDADVPDAKSDEYVNARYDAAIERAVASADTFRQAHDAIEFGRAQGGREDAEARKTEKARADMISANRGAGRTDSTAAAK